MHKAFKIIWLISMYGIIFFVWPYKNVDVPGDQNEYQAAVFQVWSQWWNHKFLHHRTYFTVHDVFCNFSNVEKIDTAKTNGRKLNINAKP